MSSLAGGVRVQGALEEVCRSHWNLSGFALGTAGTL